MENNWTHFDRYVQTCYGKRFLNLNASLVHNWLAQQIDIGMKLAKYTNDMESRA
jgi:hypothetical protein